MKLVHKLLLGYLLIITIIGTFSTFILLYTIEKSSTNLTAYREREITSFVQILNAMIVEEETLKSTAYIQTLFENSIKKLPHIKRLTLHIKNPNTQQYQHVVSTDPTIIGFPSDEEDIQAITSNKTNILYESGENGEKWIDITYAVTTKSGKAIAALGAAVSLNESDIVLKTAIKRMHSEVIDTIITAVVVAIILSFIFSFFVAKTLVSPIEKLKEAVNAFSNNKFTHPIKIKSKDEIGELSTAFNSMANELNTLYSSMEGQIDIKTKELESHFLTDSLTGMPNREALLRDMKKYKNYYLAILDIASFKDINDSYGVAVGNRVLQLLSTKAKIHLSDSNLTIYRLGADEAAILDPVTHRKGEFKNIIKQLIKLIEHDTLYFEKEDVEINISLHAGISYDPKYSLEKANIALINAKKSYEDLVVYDETIEKENKQVENLRMISKIKYAVENYNLITYYQPIVDRNSNIIKYESLIRMKDKGSVLSPHSFLNIAKKTKYYPYITKAVISQSFQEFENRDTSFSVNIEADDIINKDIQNFIKNHLENFKNPERVIFELVESENIHDLPDTKEFISFIKSKGAKIAIDDFGTGYSNFSYLLDLEPDYLKIDGSLIVNISTDLKAYYIVKTLVHFARNLDIKVIAEFIHSDEILTICKSLGIDEFQGYYFAKPSLEVKDKL